MKQALDISSLPAESRRLLARKIAAYLGQGVSAPSGSSRLEAQVRLRAGLVATPSELENALRTQLPLSMIPAAVRVVDSLPHLPNGKVDRAAAAAQSVAEVERPSPPSTSPEEHGSSSQLAMRAVWETVLQRSPIGLHDDFFALGGDSLAAMRLLTMARKRSLHFSIGDLFDHPTIAALVPQAVSEEKASTPMVAASGPVPLTPIQHWLLEKNLPNPHRWNQSMLCEVSPEFSYESVQTALTAVMRHHPALRLSLRLGVNGWSPIIVDASERSFPLRRVEPVAEREAPFEVVAEALHRSMSLERGRLLEAAWLAGVDGKPATLLLIVHHIAIDAVSWGILLEDLSQALNASQRGPSESLAPTTLSFKAYAERLSAAAQSEATRAQLPFWIHMLGAPVELPINKGTDDGENVEATAGVRVQTFDQTETSAIEAVAQGLHGGVQTVMLAALGRVLAEMTGRPVTTIGVEGHGREDLGGREDVSRTFGWFTSFFPMRLEAIEGESPDESLRRQEAQWRSLPARGIGFGLLRYLTHGSDSGLETLRSAPAPTVIFSYLGHTRGRAIDTGALKFLRWGIGNDRDPRQERPGQLEINVEIDDQRLVVQWSFNRSLYPDSAIQHWEDRLAKTLRELCGGPPKDPGNQSDTFAESGLEASDLDKLFG